MAYVPRPPLRYQGTHQNYYVRSPYELNYLHQPHVVHQNHHIKLSELSQVYQLQAIHQGQPFNIQHFNGGNIRGRRTRGD